MSQFYININDVKYNMVFLASREKSTSIKYKCIHYYACVAALSSAKEYVEEFLYFINNEISSRSKYDN